MKKILLFGAGKSATCLIDYLISTTAAQQWQLIVAESNLALAQSKVGNATHATAVALQVENADERKALVKAADIVISLLPPALHFLIAQDCIAFEKNLLTASYVDDKIKSLETSIKEKNLLFLYEMGLDPGIDHMSAMQLIHRLKKEGAVITSFLSHTGGLVAPESDDNPWHYKISWNPRNVVLAGTAGAVYKDNNNIVNIPYQQLFEYCPTIAIPGLQVPLAWYPNRDSLSYIPLYELEEAVTFIRTTLRYPSFCIGWNVIIYLGLTSTTDGEEIKQLTTYKEWFAAKLNEVELRDMDWKEYLELYVEDADHTIINRQIEFLGIADNKPLPPFTCSADILQYLLETKLMMQPQDKDMIVMLHEIKYEMRNTKPAYAEASTGMYEVRSSLVVKGEDSLRTAMAKTVGLPLGIAAKLILQGKIALSGLHIPLLPVIYEPVLKELEELGVQFSEQVS